VVPGLNLFRAPGRLLLFGVIAIALLCGHGLKTAIQLATVRRRRGWANRGLLPLALAGAALSLSMVGALVGQLPQAADVRPLRLLPVGLTDRDVVLMAAFTAAVLAACALAMRLGGRVPATALAVALVGIVTAESWVATEGYHNRRAIPAALYTEPGPADTLVAPGRDQRFVSLVTVNNMVDFQHLEVARRPNVRMGDGRLTPDGYDGGLLPTGEYVRFRAPLLGPGSVNSPDVPIIGETARVWDPSWLDRAGVAAVLTDQGADPNPPTCRCLQQVSAVDGVALWRPFGPLPSRAWVEGPAGRQPARVAVDAGEHLVVALPSGAQGRLVLADTYYPGWSATVDGRPVSIAPYAGLLRAVELPPGARQVVFDFQPASVRIGLALSGLSVVAAAVLALWPRRRRRRDDHE
jgi:hypothetical protein